MLNYLHTRSGRIYVLQFEYVFSLLSIEPFIDKKHVKQTKNLLDLED